MHESRETEAILHRMEAVRCELDEDVQEIVEGARVMGTWRYCVRTYPSICVGAALAGGYVVASRLVMGMQRGDPTPADLASPGRLPLPPKDGARGALLAFVGSLILRGVVSYAGQQAGKLIASQAAPNDRMIDREEPHC